MFSALKSAITLRGLAILALQAALIVLLVGAGWAIYRQLPASASDVDQITDTDSEIAFATPESVGSAWIPVSLTGGHRSCG